MKKLLASTLLVVSLTGCSTIEYALKPVGWVAEDICENRTEKQNATIAEQVDKATYPHTIRVQCYEQAR